LAGILWQALLHPAAAVVVGGSPDLRVPLIGGELLVHHVHDDVATIHEPPHLIAGCVVAIGRRAKVPATAPFNHSSNDCVDVLHHAGLDRPAVGWRGPLAAGGEDVGVGFSMRRRSLALCFSRHSGELSSAPRFEFTATFELDPGVHCFGLASTALD
jgi:hypothetical protein